MIKMKKEIPVRLATICYFNDITGFQRVKSYKELYNDSQITFDFFKYTKYE